ncbi:hypothetical protein [Pontibacter burrus]|uniref:Uncharacterized protein n=1 Tax=Pontibacter burrus TaxID=2704466 RepID=A0A6B3LZL5_9BACT|nr:hypothetical protein [Pontibacter burrus]NEM98944.1 hypothetical protein [Pontibacter burrus]
MKMSFVLCLIFLATSCQSDITEKQSLEAYKKGIEVLQQARGNQKEVTDRALVHFNNAVTIDPTNMEAALWKSQMEFKLGKFEKALLTANSAIEKLEDESHRLLPNFYMTAGMAEIMNGNQSLSHEYLQKASEIYEQRIEKDRNDVDAIGNKSTALCYMGKKNEALAFLNSLSLSKENQVLLEQLKAGVAEFETGKALKMLVVKEE